MFILRRINIGIYLITVGVREASFRTSKNIAECLADELIACAQESKSSYAIRKKVEIERAAKVSPFNYYIFILHFEINKY
jgi:small subunit ribosomal protein S5e